MLSYDLARILVEHLSRARLGALPRRSRAATPTGSDGGAAAAREHLGDAALGTLAVPAMLEREDDPAFAPILPPGTNPPSMCRNDPHPSFY